ncbi:PPE family protein [Mycobacterium canetti]|uniref:PPE family protein n=1 Tax=Mycobacterium canetti TaxID=78331 RepID=UPI0002A56A5E|nr:PPE family protein [Mycobacterium canetti]CCK61560.1 Conserved protein of unknown function, PPE family protein [Mycobacterium canettii CIPT 140070010]
MLTPAHVFSYQMYAGPGADSLQVAAQQLQQMAHSATTTANSLNTTLDELDENWKGRSSEWMADVALRYLKWLSNHSRQILQTARVIENLANAYEDTRQRVMHPEIINNNRQKVGTLIASNVAGVNALEIAQLDAQYQGYHACNVLAISLYVKDTRKALSCLPRWQGPPQIHRGRGG